MFYRISAALLFLATLGHTFGGMLGTARRGPKAAQSMNSGLPSGPLAGCSLATVSTCAFSQAAMKARRAAR